MPRIRPATVAVLLLLLAACTSSRSSVRAGAEPRTTLRVTNQSWLDVNMYITTGSQRIRLGSVSGNSTTRLRIPSSVVGFGREVGFIADPIGSGSVASSFQIFVRPGEEVTITIPPSVR